MPYPCEICCLTFRDNLDLRRHHASKRHLDMVRKHNQAEQELEADEEKEEMADPRILPKEVIDELILNHKTYIRISQQLTKKREKMIERFQFLHELFLNPKAIDYDSLKLTEQQIEYYSENYLHEDLVKLRYPNMELSSKVMKELLEEKECLMEELLKTHREFDREKPKWYQITMNELIAEYREQEKEIEKRKLKEMKMKQLMEMMYFKK